MERAVAASLGQEDDEQTKINQAIEASLKPGSNPYDLNYEPLRIDQRIRSPNLPVGLRMIIFAVPKS